MLMIASAAAEAIEGLLASAQMDDGGLRITTDEAAGVPHDTGYRVAVAAGPRDHDTVVRDPTARAEVYIDGSARRALDRAVLDASVDRGLVSFNLTPAQ